MTSNLETLDRAIEYYASHAKGSGGTAWMNPATVLETLALLRELKQARPAAQSWENYATAQEREAPSGETAAEPTLEALQQARLTWAMVCPCSCKACDQFYELIRDHYDDAKAPAVRVTTSPIAQAILDRVTEVNVGIFLTGAIDHIEKGGNLASGQVELRDGTLVELSMLRLPPKTACSESSGKVMKEPQ